MKTKLMNVVFNLISFSDKFFKDDVKLSAFTDWCFCYSRFVRAVLETCSYASSLDAAPAVFIQSVTPPASYGAPGKLVFTFALSDPDKEFEIAHVLSELRCAVLTFNQYLEEDLLDDFRDKGFRFLTIDNFASTYNCDEDKK